MTQHSTAAGAALTQLRAELAARGLDGLIIPRADRHLGEYPPASEERLAFVTGFTGSAGVAVATAQKAVLFVDGRYELQGAAEAGPNGFETAPTRVTPLTDWLGREAPAGARIGVDPWLHSSGELERIEAALARAGAVAQSVQSNPVDAIWTARPAPPSGPAVAHPARYAGESAHDKRARLGAALSEQQLKAHLITSPDSVCWLLNVRGSDAPNTPLASAYMLLRDDGGVTVFTDPAKFSADLRAELGEAVAIADWSEIASTLSSLSGARVGVEKDRSPAAAARLIEGAGAERVWAQDPCARPRARKNPVELAGARAAHLRDGAAICAALAWIDREAPSGALDELTVAAALTRFRAETAERMGEPLQGESFAPIVGYGPNGAIVHYRVSAQTNARITGGSLLLLDSGGQYKDGTTDITRTVAIGAPPEDARTAFTLVLKGMIAISRLRFPEKASGARLEAAARIALWAEGADYDHGTGHGVGSYLGVHEGPQALSERGAAALEAGMILSNEPGFYRVGAFGVRIENLIIVGPAAPVPNGLSDRPMRGFETLTLAPIDRRLIDIARLTETERAWLDAYHARVLDEIGPIVAADAKDWLAAACAPL